MRQNNRQIGGQHEEEAMRYLEGEGYRILEKNYRIRIGEIDLIAEKNGEIVFVEVKYRRHDSCGYPEEAVSCKKQETIRKVAVCYLQMNERFRKYDCRFDVIAMDPYEIRHIRNAF